MADSIKQKPGWYARTNPLVLCWTKVQGAKMKGARQLLEVKPQVDALCVSSLFGLDVVGL